MKVYLLLLLVVLLSTECVQGDYEVRYVKVVEQGVTNFDTPRGGSGGSESSSSTKTATASTATDDIVPTHTAEEASTPDEDNKNKNKGPANSHYNSQKKIIAEGKALFDVEVSPKRYRVVAGSIKYAIGHADVGKTVEFEDLKEMFIPQNGRLVTYSKNVAGATAPDFPCDEPSQVAVAGAALVADAVTGKLRTSAMSLTEGPNSDWYQVGGNHTPLGCYEPTLGDKIISALCCGSGTCQFAEFSYTMQLDYP